MEEASKRQSEKPPKAAEVAEIVCISAPVEVTMGGRASFEVLVPVVGPTVMQKDVGPVASWPLQMPVLMMSGSDCCTIMLDSVDVRISEIKLLIEQKSGIPQAEQDIFFEGFPVLMRDDSRLCHYAKALYSSSRKIYVVRRSPPSCELNRSTLRRLQKEFKNSQRSALLAGCALAPLDGDLDANPLRWTAMISGPSDGPYAGATFALDISLPREYPYKPPVVRFATRVFHPLVPSSGAIDLPMLHENWVPCMNLEGIILRIKEELADPYAPPGWNATNCCGCGNHEAAVLSRDKDNFDRKAREETLGYAIAQP